RVLGALAGGQLTVGGGRARGGRGTRHAGLTGLGHGPRAQVPGVAALRARQLGRELGADRGDRALLATDPQHPGHRLVDGGAEIVSSVLWLVGSSPSVVAAPGAGAVPGMPGSPDWVTVREPRSPAWLLSERASWAASSGLTEAIVRCWPRIRSTRGTDSSMAVP